jgi:hypothetical protein
MPYLLAHLDSRPLRMKHVIEGGVRGGVRGGKYFFYQRAHKNYMLSLSYYDREPKRRRHIRAARPDACVRATRAPTQARRRVHVYTLTEIALACRSRKGGRHEARRGEGGERDGSSRGCRTGQRLPSTSRTTSLFSSGGSRRPPLFPDPQRNS